MEQLPDHIKQEVLLQCSPSEFNRLCTLNRDWYRFCQNNREHIYRQKIREKISSWEELYKQIATKVYVAKLDNSLLLEGFLDLQTFRGKFDETPDDAITRWMHYIVAQNIWGYVSDEKDENDAMETEEDQFATYIGESVDVDMNVLENDELYNLGWFTVTFERELLQTYYDQLK